MIGTRTEMCKLGVKVGDWPNWNVHIWLWRGHRESNRVKLSTESPCQQRKKNIRVIAKAIKKRIIYNLWQLSQTRGDWQFKRFLFVFSIPLREGTATMGCLHHQGWGISVLKMSSCKGSKNIEIIFKKMSIKWIIVWPPSNMLPRSGVRILLITLKFSGAPS